MDSDCPYQAKCVAQPLLASGLWQEPRAFHLFQLMMATLWDLSLDFKNATAVSNCVIKTTNKGWWTMKNDKQTNRRMGTFFYLLFFLLWLIGGRQFGLLVSMSSSMKKFHELRIGSIFFSTVLGMWRSTCFPNKIVFVTIRAENIVQQTSLCAHESCCKSDMSLTKTF